MAREDRGYDIGTEVFRIAEVVMGPSLRQFVSN